MSKKSGRSAANEIKVLFTFFLWPQLVARYRANVRLLGQWPYPHLLGLPRGPAAGLPNHHEACYSAPVYGSGPFVMWTCCPQANKPRPSQMHTRVCKLKFNSGLRHGKVIFKSKRPMLHNKHQVLVFPLPLRLIRVAEI